MRLVDADELRKKAVPHTRGERAYLAEIKKWAVLVSDLDDAPTIDAVPVVHGRWEKSEHLYGYVGCSVCHDCYVWGEWRDKKKWGHCPNCGAKMDGE